MQKKTVFVIQPFDKAFEKTYEVIVSACSSAGAIAVRADSAVPVDGNFSKELRKSIFSSDLIIADVSHANPNVMYEVGLVHSANKPLILIADSSRSVPFDLAGMRVLIYDLDDTALLLTRLRVYVSDALSAPENYLLEKSIDKRQEKSSVFISYSHSDRDYLDRLLIHLRPIERLNAIDLWVDTRLRPGDRWKKEIEKALDQANVAILLVSADFLASEFIINNELPTLLRRAEENGTRIIPVILKPCRFARDSNLRHFQAVNDPTEALILVNEGNQEAIYDALAQEVERTWSQV